MSFGRLHTLTARLEEGPGPQSESQNRILIGIERRVADELNEYLFDTQGRITNHIRSEWSEGIQGWYSIFEKQYSFNESGKIDSLLHFRRPSSSAELFLYTRDNHAFNAHGLEILSETFYQPSEMDTLSIRYRTHTYFEPIHHMDYQSICVGESVSWGDSVYADSGIRFPVPFPEYCTDNALVMSFEEGIRIDDVASVKKLDITFKDLMQRLVVFYVEQMLVKGFFHADPHPGNLLISPGGELVLLDFGMVSRIPQNMRQAMIYAVKAAYERDFELLVSATRRMGILTEESDFEGLSSVAENLFEIFDSDHLKASSMQDLALGILDVMHDQPFKLPQDVIYVMRVSSLVEGLGTQYVENFNGIKDILPILRQNLPRALGEGSLPFERLQHEFVQLPITLSKTRKVVELAEQGDLVVRMASADRAFLLERLGKYLHGLGRLIFFLALAFYFQQLQQSWAVYFSVAFLIAAAVSLFRRK